MEQQRMQQLSIDDPIPLTLETVIGFNGKVQAGLKVHPDGEHLIYSVGRAVIIESIRTKEMTQLSGHTNSVSCIAVSKSGEYLASGQVTYMGFKADVIVWDYAKKQKIANLVLHKVKVQDLAFSPNDLYLVTLGGQDDGSVVVWDLKSGNIEAICGNQAQVESAGVTMCVAFSNQDDNVFATGGDGTLRVWRLEKESRKIKPTDVTMGQKKRIVTCMQMADQFEEPVLLCGTSTGDIIGINMKTYIFQFHGPTKDLFGQGVTALALTQNYELLVGSGDGEVALCKFFKKEDSKQTFFEKKRSWRDKNCSKMSSSAIESIALRGKGHQFYVGTANCQIYRFSYNEFKDGSGNLKQIDKKTGLKVEKKSKTDNDGVELVKTCHSNAVKDIVFPYGSSLLIVTCQKEEIRVWDLGKTKEVIRNIVANMTCNAVCLTVDGKTILSAWDDGKIRAYGFSKDGTKLEEKFTREDAHSKGVTAIACTSDGETIVTGGGEGQVRIWKLKKPFDKRGSYSLTLQETMMEHKGTVSDIKISKNDAECATASNDGTCITWDLMTKRRKGIVFANTLFKCLTYDDKNVQLVTSGTDRKIGFWEAGNGEKIRELDGSESGSVNSISLSPDGEFLVTGGDDLLIKVWSYKEGQCVAYGAGHSAAVLKVKVCPNQEKIVSCSEDGAILLWKFPFPPCIRH